MKTVNIFFLLFLLSISMVLHSSDQVLLIGIDSYSNDLPSLPGVKKDILMMTQVVDFLGYKKDQIKILTGIEATLAAVRQNLIALSKQVTKNDRVLIYFSGHGSQIEDKNRDEIDGADEVLLFADSQLKKMAGKSTLINVLLDDELQILLQQIPSQQVIALVDACHSGTINKSMFMNRSQGPAHEKLFRYKGMPTYKNNLQKKNLEPSLTVANMHVNYVLLSASHDDEPAISTADGSLFTRGILAVLQKIKAQHKNINLIHLQSEVSAYIKKTVQIENLPISHSPQLHGNAALSKQALFF